MKQRGGFLKSNWAYFIWFALYFTFTVLVLVCFLEDIWKSLLYAGLIYAFSVGIALSPIGEVIARVLENARPISTYQEMDYLSPIFEEVYQEALENTHSLNPNIRLYLSDSMVINAYALGRKTIIITQGAVEAFDREELKGILSHELGHHANGDTKALLIKSVGNLIFTVIFIVFSICMSLIQSITTAISRKNFIFSAIAFIVFVSKLVIDVFIFVFFFLGDLIIALNSRYSEYLADEYAYSIGYGQELINALYLLKRITLPVKMNLTDRMKSSHPHTTARIRRLEWLLDSDINSRRAICE